MSRIYSHIYFASFLIFPFGSLRSQVNFVDRCFTSIGLGPSIGNDLAAFSGNSSNTNGADVVAYSNGAWNGSLANLTIVPPSGIDCIRAVWLGSPSQSSGGEAVAIRLGSPLLFATQYTFTFTYASHGPGANSNFEPRVYTSFAPNIGGGASWGRLPAVSSSWTTNSITFTTGVAGHEWIILEADAQAGSGIVLGACGITNPYTPSISDTVVCDSDSILFDATLNPSGSYTYLWHDASTSPINTVGPVTDGWVEVSLNGCPVRDSFNIDNYLTTRTSTVVSKCPETNVILPANLAGGQIGRWYNSFNTQLIPFNPPDYNAMNAGVYRIEKVNQGNSCIDIDTFVVVDQVAIPPNLPDTAILCGTGDTLSVNAFQPGLDPFGYLWENGSTSNRRDITSAGLYWVEATTTFTGCTSRDTMIVISNSPPNVLITPDSLEICLGNNSVLNVSVNGGMSINNSYSWSGNGANHLSNTNTSSTIFDGVTAGNYLLICTVTDSIGCESSDSLDVTVDTIDIADFDYINTTFCSEGNNAPVPMINGTVGGAFSGTTGLVVDPITGEIDLSLSTDGFHTVTYQTPGNCPAQSTQNIILVIPNFMALNYWDSIYCLSNPNPLPIITGLFGGAFTGTNNLVIDPVTGLIDISSSGVGDYVIRYSISGICPVSDSFSISIVPDLDPSWNAPSFMCETDQPINLDALISGTQGGTWSSNLSIDSLLDPSTIDSILTLTYTVDTGNCIWSESHDIQINRLNVDVVIDEPQGCSGHCTEISVNHVDVTDTNDLIYNLILNAETLFRDSNSSWTACFEEARYYDLAVDITDSYGCSANVTLSNAITINPNPIADIGTDFLINDTMYDVNQSFINIYNISAGDDSFLWDYSDGFNDIDPVLGYYINGYGDHTILLTVSTFWGCIDSTSISFHVKNENYPLLFIPNTFTPDNDGLNDDLTVIAQRIELNTLQIYDRWGLMLFSTDNPTYEFWDGKYRENIVQNDTYVWKLYYKDEQGDSQSMMGNVNVIR